MADVIRLPLLDSSHSNHVSLEALVPCAQAQLAKRDKQPWEQVWEMSNFVLLWGAGGNTLKDLIGALP